jgi:hypothetical protein
MKIFAYVYKSFILMFYVEEDDSLLLIFVYGMKWGRIFFFSIINM